VASDHDEEHGVDDNMLYLAITETEMTTNHNNNNNNNNSSNINIRWVS
jgi:EAL domain-containing protein (putative c-di-GMP-specific phosphodiesterase class I)